MKVKELIDYLKECNPEAELNKLDVAWTVGDLDEEDLLESKKKCSKVTIYSNEHILTKELGVEGY